MLYIYFIYLYIYYLYIIIYIFYSLRTPRVCPKRQRIQLGQVLNCQTIHFITPSMACRKTARVCQKYLTRKWKIVTKKTQKKTQQILM